MDANEIVRALKCCSCVENQSCKRCQYEYCSKECEDLCGNAANLIESLQAKLAESQRRERAAVEDIMCCDHCDVCVSGKERGGECKKADYDCLTCKSETCMCRECRDEDHWKWRGPQEAGKGDNNGQIR